MIRLAFLLIGAVCLSGCADLNDYDTRVAARWDDNLTVLCAMPAQTASVRRFTITVSPRACRKIGGTVQE